MALIPKRIPNRQQWHSLSNIDVDVIKVETAPMPQYGRMCTICCKGFELSSKDDVRTIYPKCIEKIRNVIGIKIYE